MPLDVNWIGNTCQNLPESKNDAIGLWSKRRGTARKKDIVLDLNFNPIFVLANDDFIFDDHFRHGFRHAIGELLQGWRLRLKF